MTLATALAALLPLGLILLMLVVGLRLDAGEIARAIRAPRAMLAGLAVQMIGLPVTALVLAAVFGLSPEMSVGLLLVAAAPGGVTSNYISLLVGADLALSAAMTLVTTCLASLSLPMILGIGGIAVPGGASGLVGISLGMAGVALVPMLAGLALRLFAPRIAGGVERVFGPVSRAVFLVLVFATITRDWDIISANIGALGPAVFGLNFIALALAGTVAWLAALPGAQRRAIMVEASLQNVAIVLFVAGSLLQRPELAAPGLVYVFAMNLTALVHIARHRLRAEATAAG